MRPLVITSLNPKSRFEHQKACFDAWRERGYEARTYNSEQEADELVGRGVDPASIVRIGLEKTGHGMHRIPSPRILSVLEDVHSQGASVVLVNSDIYPALRKSSSPFAIFGSCAALTRNEIASLDIGPGSVNAPYRGGLDIFYFSDVALGKLLPALREDPAAQRMAFGIPGWDFFLGGHVISPRMGGRIADAAFLLHVSHRTTYSNLDEFNHYVEPLRQLGHVTVADSYTAARQFAGQIDRHCEQNLELARRVALATFDHQAGYRRTRVEGPGTAECIALVQAMNDDVAPSWHIDAMTVAAIVAREAQPYPVLKVAMQHQAGPALRFAAGLRALYLSLLLPSASARVRKELTTTYPKGNLHAKAVEGILEIRDPDDFRNSLLGMFGDELILYGIMNTSVLKCLALCCENDEERGLVSGICRLLREMKVDEKAT